VDEQLHKLIIAIFDDHQENCIDCDTCCQQLNYLAELVASGAEVRQLLPAVEEHLTYCADCREEYQALICIMQAELNGRTINLDYSLRKDS
jgi:predicted anti-sigma-YlaC factor YlaD